MKRSNYLTRVITLLLFAFLLVYFSGMVLQAVQNPLRTAPAVFTEIEEGFITPGMIVREEYVIQTQYPILSSLVRDGERVSVGMAYLSAYATQADRERSARRRMLEEEITQLEAQNRNAGQQAGIEVEIRRGLRELAQSTRTGDFSNLESQTIGLRALAFLGDETSLNERITHLRAEKQQIDAQGVNVNLLRAYRAGVYSSRVDGLEHINIASIREMSHTELRQMLGQNEPVGDANAAGKLITGTNWYYVTLVPEAEYEALYLRYSRQVANRLMVRFGNVNNVPMRILYLGEPTDGYVKLILASTTALADTINMRYVEAEVSYRTVSGIRVPQEAVHFGEVDPETGRPVSYVFTLTVNAAEQKFVHIIYAGDDFYLVSPDMERTAAARALREGNSVIIRARHLYDGRIVRR